MGKTKLDLSVKKNALASMNNTALIGATIMNVVLALAYLIEVLKGARPISSYLVIAVFCALPTILSALEYKRRADSNKIRYISGIGFCMLYGYLMFTSPNDLTFCYIVVFFVLFVVYMDKKLLLILGGYALVTNIAVIGMKAVTGAMTGETITSSEIIIACLVMTCMFTVMALTKVEQINEANVDKADREKGQADELLQTTLGVANSITENINIAFGETDSLRVGIADTQKAMQDLTTNTNQEAEAIEIQKKSTNRINRYIQKVEEAVKLIVAEVNTAEENLNAGNSIMKELLKQVQISEVSSTTVVEKMQGLKEYTEKMQSIMQLISSVANQTGLLALNASIEAARAGEAGRGFSVVATEISNLSAQTNNATSDINELIQNIVSSVDDVGTSMEQLLESSQLQNQFVDQTAGNFEKIHENTQEIVTQVSHLQKTVDVVTSENRQVEEGIENVAEITQKMMQEANETLESCNVNLQSIAKVAGIMEELLEEAKKLQG